MLLLAQKPGRRAAVSKAELLAGGSLTISLLEKAIPVDIQSGHSPSNLLAAFYRILLAKAPGISEEVAKEAAAVRGRLEIIQEAGRWLSVEQAARRLGVDVPLSGQAVRKAIADGRLIAMRSFNHWALPDLQFRDGGGLLPGMREVLQTFSGHPAKSDLLALGFLLDPHHLLDGRRPLDILREGKPDAIRRVTFAAESELY
jgi:hypothetical protein